MDSCLQNILHKIAIILGKEHIDGECCITTRKEQYLNDRAETHFNYSNYRNSIRSLLQSIRYSNITKYYTSALEPLLIMLHDEYKYFKLDDYDNVYILFGFYCPLHLQNTNQQNGSNLIIYLVTEPHNNIWSTISNWSGINSMRKYLGYNNYLPYDQY